MVGRVVVNDLATQVVRAEEIIVGNKYAGEELVFVANPFELVGNRLVVAACLAQVVDIAVLSVIFIENSAVALLEHFSHFVACRFLVPMEVECGNVGRYHSVHVLLYDFHAD